MMKYHCFTCGVEFQQSVKFECFLINKIKLHNHERTPKGKKKQCLHVFSLITIRARNNTVERENLYINIITYPFYIFYEQLSNKRIKKKRPGARDWQKNTILAFKAGRTKASRVKVDIPCNNIGFLVTWFKQVSQR